MIYTIHGINAKSLINLIQTNKTKRIKIDSRSEHANFINTRLSVEVADLNKRDDLKVREKTAKILSDSLQVPVTPDNIMPYMISNGIAIIVANDDKNISFFIPELNFYGEGIMERIAEELKIAGVEIEWGLDDEASLARDLAAEEDDTSSILDGLPSPWPIAQHSKHCTCKPCSELRMQFLKHDERDKITEQGWVTHVVFDDTNSPTKFNAHTHINQEIGHKDFQIVLPVPGQVAGVILGRLVERVKEGQKFTAGTTIENLFPESAEQKPFNVALIDATESGRSVLRVILPDNDGNLTLEQFVKTASHVDFALQYDPEIKSE